VFKGCGKLSLSNLLTALMQNSRSKTTLSGTELGSGITLGDLKIGNEMFKGVGADRTDGETTYVNGTQLKNWFDNLTNVENIDQMFANTKGLNTLPDYLFENCSAVTRMVGLFANLKFKTGNRLSVSSKLF
jgi:hypothetical protein